LTQLPAVGQVGLDRDALEGYLLMVNNHKTQDFEESQRLKISVDKAGVEGNLKILKGLQLTLQTQNDL
jgi:hypothetical protein